MYSFTVSHHISGPHCQAKFVTSAIVVFYPWWITMADGHFSSFWCSLCCWCWDCSGGPGHQLTWQGQSQHQQHWLTDWLGYWKPITATIFLTWGELIFNLNSGSFCRIKQGTEKKWWISICNIFWQWGCHWACDMLHWFVRAGTHVRPDTWTAVMTTT